MSEGDEIALPKSTMSRVIKERLPEDMKIAAEANEVVMRCCEEFVHMIAATANEISEKEKKSTIVPDHILKSLEELGFTSYIDNLNAGKSLFILLFLSQPGGNLAEQSSACSAILLLLLIQIDSEHI